MRIQAALLMVFTVIGMADPMAGAYADEGRQGLNHGGSGNRPAITNAGRDPDRPDGNRGGDHGRDYRHGFGLNINAYGYGRGYYRPRPVYYPASYYSYYYAAPAYYYPAYQAAYVAPPDLPAPPPPPETYVDGGSGAYCREFSQQINVGGQIQESYGTACLQPDGSWRVVQ